MRQQEDFRTRPGAAGDAPPASSVPLFDERSARTAAPVVPLAKVSRGSRFPLWAGGWRETVNSPRFRRSWPLALLLLATLAAVAAANFSGHDGDAQPIAPTTAATAAGTAATAAEQSARDGSDDSRAARPARRASEDDAAPDEKSVANPAALTASALGQLIGDDGGASAARDDDASARDGRDGGRDNGKRSKGSKRREGSRRTRGGAILFDVIR